MHTVSGLIMVIVMTAFIVSATPVRAKEYLTREQAFKLAFPGDTITSHTMTLTLEQREQIGKLTQAAAAPRFDYLTAMAKGIVQGYAVPGEARSKSDPFSYLLLLNPDCSIRMVEILTYSGIRGHEVRQKGFLNQFNGKTARDKIQLRSDIKNMAGATISCQSLTDSIRRRMAYVSVLLPPPADPKPACHRRTQYAMGTLLEIAVYADDRAAANQAITAAFAEVARLEAIFTTYRPESEASRLNRAVPGTPVAVSEDFITLLLRSRDIAEHTQGAFDVTVAPLVELWRNAAKAGVPPSEPAIAAARQAVGQQHLVIDEARRTVARARDGVCVDFGGIAKGYALDRAADILEKAGFTSALLNFGGQYLAAGPPADQPYWRIHIRHPQTPDDPATSLAELHLTTGSVATTGDYERGMVIGGQHYSHIIDPRSGAPVSGMLSVTVMAATGTEADALSTGLYVLGFTEGQRYAGQHGTALLMMDAKGVLVKTGAFSQ